MARIRRRALSRMTLLSAIIATAARANNVPVFGRRLIDQTNAGRNGGLLRRGAAFSPLLNEPSRRRVDAPSNRAEAAFVPSPSIATADAPFGTGRFRPFHARSNREISFLAARRPFKSSTELLLASKSTPDVVGGNGAAYHATANQQLVRRRNEISRQKKDARRKALDRDRERNLKLRTLFSEEGGRTSINHGENDSEDRAPPMFAVKVVACPALRSELRMNGREKRGRMFVERPPSLPGGGDKLGEGDATSDATGDANHATAEYACTSLTALRRTIHEFFRRLKKSTYVLSGSLPTLDEEGNVLTHADDDPVLEEDGTSSDAQLGVIPGTWPLESDEDVKHAFMQAEEFFLRHRSRNETTALKRPTLILHVTKDPNAAPPPPPPPYLLDMADPNSSPTMTMLSFYSFPPDGGVEDPESTAERLRRLWRPFKALGRIYMANEGINAQMAVPTNVLTKFLECCTLPPSKGGELSNILGEHMENGMNVDPIPVSMEEFREDPPFRNLHVRVRSQIVADGLEKPLDWANAGYDMPPLEWHAKLKEAREAQKRSEEENIDCVENRNPPPIVLDCRNDYETQVGRFELAEPLETENFRESWDALRERLRDVPKDAPIMTYCTGGIRCVKVNAYLTQELGFANVSRLAGGVVAYDRILNERAPTEEPMFKGVNYVFDGRMGRRITDDRLGTCHTCGRKTHLITNCKNSNCHKRMVQCEHCSDSFFGTCSEGCKTRVVNSMKDENEVASTKRGPLFATAPEEEKKEEAEQYITCSTLDDYALAHSTEPPPLLREIEANTAALLPSGAHMVSGSTQGSLLTMLASASREGRVLEIGTFTGYATACFLDGAAATGNCLGTNEAGSRDRGPFVLSLERDRRALGVASAHLRAMADFGVGVEGAAVASKLRQDVSHAKDFDGDSISFAYNNVAGCELLRVNDALATVEEMARGNPAQYAAFDIVFVDADKTRLMEYVDALVSNDRVLKKGGLIIVDNVLWKGLVLDAASGGKGYESSDEDLSSDDKESLRKNRRARKLANKMHRFNSAVVRDDRVDVLMMNLRDGLSMIRKR